MPRKSKSASADSAQSEAVEAALAKTTPSSADGAAPGGENIPAGGINDKIRNLIRLSKEQGYLTFDDINEALPESVENQEEIDNVLSILQNLEIEILEPDQVEDYKQRQEEAEEEESRTSQNDILDDPVRMYLKQMGQVPLLTREQEVEISKRIETAELRAQEALFQAAVIGGYIGALGAKLLSREERFDRVVIDKKIESREAYFKGLEKLVGNTQKSEATVAEGWEEYLHAKGDAEKKKVHSKFKKREKAHKAKTEMVEANLRLVISIAKKYTNRGLSFLDLIQEGNMGLMKAVEKFEYRRGYKFSTYATWWIRQAITRSIADQARTIRIPVHMIETINKLMRVQKQLVQDYGREPTPEEVADEIQPPRRARPQQVLKMAQQPISLQSPVGDSDDTSPSAISSPRTSPPRRSLRHDRRFAPPLKEKIRDVLDTLTERERQRARAALRPRGRLQPHARGSRQAVQSHPRAHPPDRGEGAPQNERAESDEGRRHRAPAGCAAARRQPAADEPRPARRRQPARRPGFSAAETLMPLRSPARESRDRRKIIRPIIPPPLPLRPASQDTARRATTSE